MLTSVDLPFTDAPFRWGVGGGWALDLYLGTRTRDHADIDISVPRTAQKDLYLLLKKKGWSLQKCVDKQFLEWDGREYLELPVHEVRAKRLDGREIEVVFSEREGNSWVYRRDPRVRRTLDKSIITSKGGVPILAPEIVLLFKSKAMRQKDEADFNNVLPALSPEPRNWLRDALLISAPCHPWIPSLQA